MFSKSLDQRYMQLKIQITRKILRKIKILITILFLTIREKKFHLSLVKEFDEILGCILKQIHYTCVCTLFLAILICMKN